MPKLYVARRATRAGLLIPTEGTGENPSLMFFLPRMESSQLDELVRSNLEKQGITSEADVQALVNKAEADYEQRVKVQEADKEVRRLMALKAGGAKLMQFGYKKWKQVFYPAVRK